MTDSSSDIDRVRTIYDRLAPSWSQREGFVERVLMGSAMRQDLAHNLHGDVLELGAGTGATFPLLDWTAITSLVATDLSDGMLAQARRHPAIQDKPVTFRQVEASHLPFEDNDFDTVTTSLMLCTVPDPELTLREMSRVVRPTGRIVVLEHVLSSNRLAAALQRRLSPWQQRHMGCHLDRTTDQLAREMGFPIEQDTHRFLSIFHLIIMRPLPIP